MSHISCKKCADMKEVSRQTKISRGSATATSSNMRLKDSDTYTYIINYQRLERCTIGIEQKIRWCQRWHSMMCNCSRNRIDLISTRSFSSICCLFSITMKKPLHEHYWSSRLWYPSSLLLGVKLDDPSCHAEFLCLYTHLLHLFNAFLPIPYSFERSLAVSPCKTISFTSQSFSTEFAALWLKSLATLRHGRIPPSSIFRNLKFWFWLWFRYKTKLKQFCHVLASARAK